MVIARFLRGNIYGCADLNAGRPLRPHIVPRDLHCGNRYLLVRSMNSGPGYKKGPAIGPTLSYSQCP
jgi:hypothetical protein